MPHGWAEPGEDEPEATPESREESWAAQAARDLTANAPLQPLQQEQPAPPPPAPASEPSYQQPQPLAPAPQYQQPAPQQYQPAPPPQQVQQPAPQQHQQPVPPEPATHGAPLSQGGWIRFNGLALSNETRVATVNGVAVDLTRTEFDLLSSLLSTGRRVRSKADLVLTMRGQQYVTSYFVNEADKRSVEVHIANLRRKIGDDAGTPRFIETVRGVGYRLAETA
jgi:DNA-binding winged helix-turn-helix (wHTH) protein